MHAFFIIINNFLVFHEARLTYACFIAGLLRRVGNTDELPTNCRPYWLAADQLPTTLAYC